MKSRFSRARAKNKIMAGLVANAVERQREQDEEVLVPPLIPNPSCSNEIAAQVGPVIDEIWTDPIPLLNDDMGMNENEGHISDESDSNETDNGMEIDPDTNEDVNNDQDLAHQQSNADDFDAEGDNPELRLPQQLDPDDE